jgi:RNA polymerase sigma-70 factor (ECF subfamily)
MFPAGADSDHALERYRSYLLLFAETRLDMRLRGTVDPADAVQQCLMKAYQARQQFRGTTEGELVAWLRQILARELLHLVRDLRRARRDVTREKSLERALDESSARLDQWIAAEQSSPSQHVARVEQELLVSAAVQSLPAAQRDAVVMYYWKGWKPAEIGRHMDRTAAAVAGLLHRGLERLREQLDDSI